MSRGFVYTLLVIVAGGLLLLWHTVGPAGQRGDDSRSGIARVRGDYQSIATAIKTYAITAGRPPTTDQGLEALVTRPTLEPLPKDWVKLAAKVPKDPWLQPYHYRELPAKEGAIRFEIRSMGADGKLWTEDDRHQEFDWKGP
jgi:general secretion pathway protein G